jgi:hypothetical protein
MADLDADPQTPDNVIVFSDKDVGRIRAIDGYSLTPYSRKQAQREFYGALPDPKERAKMRKEEVKKLKSYLSKNYTAEKQAKNPYDTYEVVQSAYANVRTTVKYFCDVWLVGVGRPGIDKAGTIGALTPPHFLQLLQVLTKAVYEKICKIIFDLPDNYFLDPNDPVGIKKAAAKNLLKDLTKIASGAKYSDFVRDIIADDMGEGGITAAFQEFARIINAKEQAPTDVKDVFIEPILVRGFKEKSKSKGRYFDILDRAWGKPKVEKEWLPEGTVRGRWNTYNSGRPGTVLVEVPAVGTSSSGVTPEMVAAARAALGMGSGPAEKEPSKRKGG